MSQRWWRDRSYFTPSRPRKAEGGIKAQSKRGGFGESWWAKRWIQVLESFDIGARLGRGRSYARGGQVLSIAVEKGRITAKVQGSRPKPYDIVIEVKTLSDAEWSKVIEALAARRFSPRSSSRARCRRTSSRCSRTRGSRSSPPNVRT